MSENPYEPPLVECRSPSLVDHAGRTLVHGFTAILAGLVAYYIANAVTHVLVPLTDQTAQAAFRRWSIPQVASIAAGLAWFTAAYLISLRRARMQPAPASEPTHSCGDEP